MKATLIRKERKGKSRYYKLSEEIKYTKCYACDSVCYTSEVCVSDAMEFEETLVFLVVDNKMRFSEIAGRQFVKATDEYLLQQLAKENNLICEGITK